MRIYLDTSVVSAYLDERAPERQAQTVGFWPSLAAHDVLVSDLVIEEIEATPDGDQRQRLRALVDGFARLDSTTAAVLELAQAYIRLGALPDATRADALHVAVATVDRVEIVLSWNLRHLVRLRTRRAVTAVNTLLGYGPIEILTPPEL